MEYKNETLGVKFTLPDSLTVRQQLAYRGVVFSAGSFTNDIYIRYWLGFLSLLEGQEWECEALPKPEELDMDAVNDIKIADIVFWVGNRTAAHMLALEDMPKN